MHRLHAWIRQEAFQKVEPRQLRGIYIYIFERSRNFYIPKYSKTMQKKIEIMTWQQKFWSLPTSPRAPPASLAVSAFDEEHSTDVSVHRVESGSGFAIVGWLPSVSH